MSALPIGTIVRAYPASKMAGGPTWLAVVVPFEGMINSSWLRKVARDQVSATVPLTMPPAPALNSVNANGAWVVGTTDAGSVWDYDLLHEDEISEEIEALAMRVLLDPTFRPVC